jgi:hypothetical protein
MSTPASSGGLVEPATEGGHDQDAGGRLRHRVAQRELEIRLVLVVGKLLQRGAGSEHALAGPRLDRIKVADDHIRPQAETQGQPRAAIRADDHVGRLQQGQRLSSIGQFSVGEDHDAPHVRTSSAGGRAEARQTKTILRGGW